MPERMPECVQSIRQSWTKNIQNRWVTREEQWSVQSKSEEREVG